MTHSCVEIMMHSFDTECFQFKLKSIISMDVYSSICYSQKLNKLSRQKHKVEIIHFFIQPATPLFLFTKFSISLPIIPQFLAISYKFELTD